MWSFIKIGLTVSEEMSFKAIVDYALQLMTDAEQRLVTIAHHEHFVLRWAKKSISADLQECENQVTNLKATTSDKTGVFSLLYEGEANNKIQVK